MQQWQWPAGLRLACGMEVTVVTGRIMSSAKLKYGNTHWILWWRRDEPS